MRLRQKRRRDTAGPLPPWRPRKWTYCWRQWSAAIFQTAPGITSMPGCSGNGGCYPTSSRPITPILRPGAPSVLADRHRRGAMYGWRQTCAIPGRRSSVQRTQPFWRRENLVTDDPQDWKSTRLKLQSLMRISYAVFCLHKKKIHIQYTILYTNVTQSEQAQAH